MPIQTNHITALTLAGLAVLLLSCGRDEVVVKPDDDSRIRAEWRQELQQRREEDVPADAAIALTASGVKTSFLNVLCGQPSFEILGVEYYIKNVATGLVRMQADQEKKCETLFLNLLQERLIYVATSSSDGAPTSAQSAPAFESVRGIRARARPATLLKLLDTRPEIRAIRLYHEGIPMDIPWPDQPLSNAAETSR